MGKLAVSGFLRDRRQVLTLYGDVVLGRGKDACYGPNAVAICPLTQLYSWQLPFVYNNSVMKALIVASKEIGLEVKVDKTKYMVMSRDQNN